jgi:hypothetical protein
VIGDNYKRPYSPEFKHPWSYTSTSL